MVKRRDYVVFVCGETHTPFFFFKFVEGNSAGALDEPTTDFLYTHITPQLGLLIRIGTNHNPDVLSLLPYNLGNDEVFTPPVWW